MQHPNGRGSNQYRTAPGVTVAPGRAETQAVADAVDDETVAAAVAFGADLPTWRVGTPLDPQVLTRQYGPRFRDARVVQFQGEEYDSGETYRFESWALVAGDVSDDAGILRSARQAVQDCFADGDEDAAYAATETGFGEALFTVPARYWHRNGIIPAESFTGPLTESTIEPQSLFIEEDELGKEPEPDEW